jgi:hypothetical protein
MPSARKRAAFSSLRTVPETWNPIAFKRLAKRKAL